MYSIIIAVVLFALGIYMLKHELNKALSQRNRISLLTAILTISLGVMVAFGWLLIVCL